MPNKRMKDVWQTKNKGIYYAQKFCRQCWKLITGESKNANKGARSDLGTKFGEHKKKCHK